MDHPAPLAHENPWRSTALVAAGIAALELLLIVVLAFGIFVRPLCDRDSGTATAGDEGRAGRDVPRAAPRPRRRSDAKAAQPARAPRADEDARAHPERQRPLRRRQREGRAT